MMTINLVFACQPIAELVLLFAWPLSSLLGVIFLKCLWFSKISFKKGFSFHSSFEAMFIANIATTIIAVILCLIFIAPSLILFFLIIFVILCHRPAVRLYEISPWPIHPLLTEILMVILLFFSLFFLGIAKELGVSSINYWLAKLAYIYCGLAVSFFLTALWEEFIVGSILESSFLPEVLTMNLYIMLFVWGISAISVLTGFYSNWVRIQVWGY